MNVAIIGFGKLGKKIAGLIEQDDQLHLGLTINSDNTQDLILENFSDIDVAIEISGPNFAYTNLSKLAEFKVTTICGSTGWTSLLPEIQESFTRAETGFLYASNFSLGMNIFFELNKRLAKLMSEQTFKVAVEEIHHIHKIDKPSGTSLTIANDIIRNHKGYDGWKLSEDGPRPVELPIKAIREGEVNGDHQVSYESKYERLTMHHSATDRIVFAEGALAAAKWIQGKNGIYTMNDVIGL